jgi:glutamine kinase
VIKSYFDKRNTNENNQILVQDQSKNIVSSGVIFTRSNESGSPYYIINYDISDSTDSVTQGKIGNTIKIFRNTKYSKIPKKWKKLLEAVQEIEKILDSTFLDIEFGIKKLEESVSRIFSPNPL